MPEPRTLEAGATLDGTYTIDALIGRGGMGAVYRASHARLPGKQVAIKILHAELDDADMRARFRREAEIASRLSHPNIAAIIDFNVLPDGTPYLVLEYLRGETLSARLRRGRFELAPALAIVRQIGAALAAAHAAGVVHRDLKPGNIFLCDGEVAKLLDFGVSKLRGSQSVTTETTLLGTPEYMSPEQARGASVDHRADLFAFGLIVYEMLSGQPAFAGEAIHEVVYRVVHEPLRSLDELAPQLPREVVAAVARACAKDADARFASAGDFIAALTGEAVSLPPPAASLSFAGASLPATVADRPPRADATAPPTAVTRPSRRPSSSPPPSRSPSPSPSPSRSRSLALVIAGVAIAGAIVFAALELATRAPQRPASPLPPPPPRDTVSVVAVVDAAVPAPPLATPDAAALDLLSPDASPATATRRAPLDAPPPRARPDAAVAHGPDEIEDPFAASGIGHELADAETALARRDWASAERLAIAVLHEANTTDAQRVHAHAIHGIVACAGHANLEDANSDLRAVGASSLRRRIVAACQAAGIAIDDPN